MSPGDFDLVVSDDTILSEQKTKQTKDGVSTTQRIFTNSKNGEQVKTELTFEQAFDIVCKKQNSTFAQSLCASAKSSFGLRGNQLYWFYKLAEDNKPSPEVRYDLEVDTIVSLMRRLTETSRTKTGSRLMWRITTKDADVSKSLPRIKLYHRSTDSEQVEVVYSAGDFWRKIGVVKGTEFVTNNKCPKVAIIQLAYFAKDPMEFMKRYGKDFGRCMVCGRELENEESVALGIGPICAARL